MVGEKYSAVDGLAVPDTRLCPGSVIYRSGGLYWGSTFEQLDAEPVLDRISGILEKSPNKMDENLKQIFDLTGNHVLEVRIEKNDTMSLKLSDGDELVVDKRVGLPAALSEGAPIYVDRSLLRPLEELPEVQPYITEAERNNGFHGIPEPFEASLPEVDEAKEYDTARLKFKGAYMGITKAKYLKPEDGKTKIVMPLGVSIELEFGDGPKMTYMLGHKTVDPTEKGRGTGDDLLKVAYLLGDEGTKIVKRAIGRTKIIPVEQDPFMILDTRCTDILLDEFLGDSLIGSYRVELQAKPPAQPILDVMERALLAKQEGKEWDIYRQFGKNDVIADTVDLEALLLLRFLDKEEGARISAIYLDFLERIPAKSEPTKAESEWVRAPGEKAFVVE